MSESRSEPLTEPSGTAAPGSAPGSAPSRRPEGARPAASWQGPSSLLQRHWPAPARVAPAPVLGGLALVGMAGAATLKAPVGVQWPVIALLILVTCRLAARAGSAEPPDPRDSTDRWSGRVLAGLALALIGVGAVRTSGPMVVLCLLAAVAVSAVVALGGRQWPAILLAVPVLSLAAARGALWVGRGMLRTRRPLGIGPWVRGTIVALALCLPIGALLVSGDAAFDGLVSAMIPDLDPDLVPVRVVLGGLVVALALPLAFASAAGPRWDALTLGRPARPAAEWAVPLAAVDALLTAFLMVQAAVLFDAYPRDLVVGDLTPAGRARQGFGELTTVTLLAVALLAWAGWCARSGRRRDRRLLIGLGGGLLGLVLIVVGSAIRRMWLYEQAFGWTVLRVDVAAFELWLGLAVVLASGAWLLGRSGLIPRLVVGSAAGCLLLLALAGPDALVASGNVDRYERTGKLDLEYLGRLSDDAVPALSRLPRAERNQVLADRELPSAPWYAANLSRIRSRHTLVDLHLGKP